MSCSIAAARNVSAAARTTRFPSSRYRAASLPIVVVLPVPLTPTTRMTDGPPSYAGWGSHAPGWRGTSRAASSARTAASGPAGSRRARARSTTCMASAPPTSPAINVSSTSSQSGPPAEPPTRNPRSRDMKPDRLFSSPIARSPASSGSDRAASGAGASQPPRSTAAAIGSGVPWGVPTAARASASSSSSVIGASSSLTRSSPGSAAASVAAASIRDRGVGGHGGRLLLGRRRLSLRSAQPAKHDP